MYNDDEDVIINHHAHQHLPDGIINYLFQTKHMYNYQLYILLEFRHIFYFHHYIIDFAKIKPMKLIVAGCYLIII